MKICKNNSNSPNTHLFFCIAGTPHPLLRPRFNSRGACHKAYDPQRDLKEQISFELMAQRPPLFLIMCNPITLNITFFMPIPKLSKPKTQKLIGQPHHKKPDLSNLIKFVEDVSNGILFLDDAIITQIIAKKVYDLNPRTEFYLEIAK